MSYEKNCGNGLTEILLLRRKGFASITQIQFFLQSSEIIGSHIFFIDKKIDQGVGSKRWFPKNKIFKGGQKPKNQICNSE